MNVVKMCVLFLLLNLFIKNEYVLVSIYGCPFLMAQMVKKVKVKVAQSCPTLYSPWNSPGQNTGVGNLSLLQGIFPTQRSKPYSFHFRACDGSVKIFYFFPGPVLESCTFLRICPFLP